jgi:uncharacterized protein (DUF2225 family)
MDKKNSVYTYLRTTTCPICGGEFSVKQYRSTRLRVVKRDADHHHWYADNQHPLWYFVVVCPSCGYAAGSNYFSEINEKEINRIRGKTSGLKLFDEINVDRDDPSIVAECFGHAIRVAQAASFVSSVLAGIYLRTAWFCREIEDEEQEVLFLRLAYQNYERAYEREKLPIGPMSRLGLLYLLGELARRLGDYPCSSLWFNEGSRCKKELNDEPQLAKLLHEQYQIMREQYKAQRQGR